MKFSVTHINSIGRQVSLFFLTCVLLVFFQSSGQSSARDETEDHLIPVQRYMGSAVEYDTLWRQKLLVKSSIATFAQLPGSSGVETVVCLYRDEKHAEALPGGFWLRIAQPSRRLSDCVASVGNAHPIDAAGVRIKVCETPLPQSTALAIQRAWTKMLNASKPDPKAEQRLAVDSSRELFSVSDRGETLEAEAPGISVAELPKIKRLLEIAFALSDYCALSDDKKQQMDDWLEAAARSL